MKPTEKEMTLYAIELEWYWNRYFLAKDFVDLMEEIRNDIKEEWIYPKSINEIQKDVYITNWIVKLCKS